MKCAAILLAAGSSSRMQGIDKIFTPLDGQLVLRRSAIALCASEKIDSLVIVTRAERIAEVEKLCGDLPKLRVVVGGGDSRAASVQCGLAALAQDCDLVAVHDGARPLVTVQVIDEAIEKAAQMGAAVPAIPVHDTLKRAKDALVLDTPERASLFAAQTPQVFERGLLQCALQSDGPFTDDASAVEALGHAVALTAGSEENLKLTTPIDFCVAEAILRNRRKRDANRSRL